MAQLMLINPLAPPSKRGRKKMAKRKPAKRKRTTVARRKNPISRRARPVARKSVRRRRNPIAARGIMATTIQPALIGATGSVLVDGIFANVPLPSMVATGGARHLAKGVAAVALGSILAQSKLVKKSTAQQLASGSLTVTLSDAAREYIPSVTGVSLGGLGYMTPAIQAGVPSRTVRKQLPTARRSNVPAGSTVGEYMGEYVS